MLVASLPLLALSAAPVWQAGGSPWRTACLVALVVMHLSLLLRSALPWVTYAATGLGALVLLASPALPPTATSLPGPLPPVLLPSSALFGVAIYSVAAHARSYRPLAALVGVAGAIELSAALWNGLPWLVFPTIPEAWRAAVGFVGATLALLAYACGRWRMLVIERGDLDSSWSRASQEGHSRDLDLAVTQQQARMAGEVHRAVAAHLEDILDQAREGRRAARRAPGLAADALADITTSGEEALGRVQTLLALLDAPDPHDALAREASTSVLAPEHALSPQPQLADLPRLIDAARGAGLAVTLEMGGERRDLSVAGQLALYRTVQEGLTNTVQHAGPGAVAHVEFDWEGPEAEVVVEDEVPAHRDAPALGESLFTEADYVEGRGLRAVRERLEALGGYLEVEQLADGYRVRGVVPRDAHLLPG